MWFKKLWRTYRFPLLLLVSIFLGMITGVILGEDANCLKPFGLVFMNMLFTIVVPLVFFTISSSIASMSNLKRLGKILGWMLLVFGITSLIASVFMLIGVLIVNPVGDTTITLTEGVKGTFDLGTNIVDMFTVGDFNQLLSKAHMFPLIIFSILFGLSVSIVGTEAAPLKKILSVSSSVMMKLINIIMYYAPIGLFAYFACLTGEYGPSLIGSYAKTFIFYLIMSTLYYVFFYSLYTYIVGGKKGVKKAFKAMFLPTITALGTCSSLATLPSNLKATEDLGIDKDIRDVTLPIGATMHMEGSSMASVLKIAFLFAIFGKPFTGIDTITIALLISILSGVVMSGIPGGGLIGEILIVSMYNFPLTAFPIIATLGWLVDSPATALNAVGDIPSSMMISKILKNSET
jgi:Na+/H+-dicarboxylate symporters